MEEQKCKNYLSAILATSKWQWSNAIENNWIKRIKGADQSNSLILIIVRRTTKRVTFFSHQTCRLCTLRGWIKRKQHMSKLPWSRFDDVQRTLICEIAFGQISDDWIGILVLLDCKNCANSCKIQLSRFHTKWDPNWVVETAEIIIKISTKLWLNESYMTLKTKSIRRTKLCIAQRENLKNWWKWDYLASSTRGL